MALQGKGYFIWQIKRCEDGDVRAIADLAHQANLTHILIKVADGTSSYNISQETDLVPPLVSALRAKGIECWGWHYLYGDFPSGEADQAIQRINKLGLDGYALDVEGEYKQAGKEEAARSFMNRLRKAHPKLPISLCSYRFPSFHPQIPWKLFLENCDYNMPQVYWEQAHNPVEQLRRCVQEFQSLAPYRPIIPVASAYVRSTWEPTPTEILQFMITAQELGLSAANFWERRNTRTNLPITWNIIRDFPWDPLPPVKDFCDDYFEALNQKDIIKLTSLYRPDAVHVNAQRTGQGAQIVQEWYQELLGQHLPGAVFKRISLTSAGNSRYFNWTAQSDKGQVLDGSDTLALLDGRIVYHYTQFSISV